MLVLSSVILASIWGCCPGTVGGDRHLVQPLVYAGVRLVMATMWKGMVWK